MRIGSLFSGAGGLDLAVEQVFGGNTVWHCENDQAASKVLAAHWPGVPNLGDIRYADWACGYARVDTPNPLRIEPVDVLCGGFPCQDVSAAGRRAGIREGTRSGLWAHFADAIAALRPRIVVIENVRGLLSARAHRAMESAETTVGNGSDGPILRALGAVLGDLSDLGYDAQWTTVAAADIGAPHRRERVFILATDAARGGRPEGEPEAARIKRRPDARPSGDPTDAQEPVTLLPTPAATDALGARNNTYDRKAPVKYTYGDTLGDLIHRGDLLPTPAASRSGNNQSPSPGAAVRPSLDSINDLLPTPNAQDGNGGGRYNSEGHQTTLPGTVRDLLPTPISRDSKGPNQRGDDSCLHGALLPTPEAKNAHAGPDYARMARDGSGGHDLVTAIAYDNVDSGQWGKYEPAILRWEALTRPVPSPTEPNSKGNPRLHAPFSEWMQGWPAGWVTAPEIGLTRNEQLARIGNGVCPQQAYAATLFLLSVCAVAA